MALPANAFRLFTKILCQRARITYCMSKSAAAALGEIPFRYFLIYSYIFGVHMRFCGAKRSPASIRYQPRSFQEQVESKLHDQPVLVAASLAGVRGWWWIYI